MTQLLCSTKSVKTLVYYIAEVQERSWQWLLILEMNIEWKRYCLCSVMSWSIANIPSQPLSRTEALIFPAATLSNLKGTAMLKGQPTSNDYGICPCVSSSGQHLRAILPQRSLGCWLWSLLWSYLSSFSLRILLPSLPHRYSSSFGHPKWTVCMQVCFPGLTSLI